MKEKLFPAERGQTLVFFIVILVVLVGMLALGLDSGFAYVMRRAAQNAADAGALAGAQALCDGNVGTDATTQANEFSLNRNPVPAGIKSKPFGYPIVNTSSQEVTVRIDVTYDTLLGGITWFDQPDNMVSAMATAACYPADTTVGAMPVTKYCGTAPNNDPTQSDCDEIQFSTLDDTCTYGVDKFYVFFNKSTGQPNDEPGDITDDTPIYWCDNFWGPPPTSSPNGAAIYVVNCDFTGPDDGDEYNMEPVMTSYSNHSWMWVDLSPNQTCSNTSCLRDVIGGTTQYSVSTHTWVASASGGHTGVYDDILPRIGDLLVIPIIDNRCSAGDPRIFCIEKIHPQDAYFIGTGGGSAEFFHIVSFAMFKVSGVCKNGANCTNGGDNQARQSMIETIPPSTVDPQGGFNVMNNVRGFEGCFVTGYLPNLGGISRTNTYTGANTVYLKSNPGVFDH